jgi:hypothetical protein
MAGVVGIMPEVATMEEDKEMTEKDEVKLFVNFLLLCHNCYRKSQL